MWEKCSDCTRPTICRSNLLKLRAMFGGCIIATCAAGVVALPVIGFTTGGVAAGSAAAAWQSSIGSLAAGSLFAILQSLGATGLGSLLFGSIGTAMGLLGTLAVKLDWCDDKKTYVKIDKIKESCSDGCMTTYQLKIRHIDNLTTHQSEEFKFGNLNWKFDLYKHRAEANASYFGLDLIGNESCKVRVVARVLPQNQQVEPVKRSKIQEIEAQGRLCIDNLMSWVDLFNIKSEFVQNTSVIMEIEITDGTFFENLTEMVEEKPNIESLLIAETVAKKGFFQRLTSEPARSDDTKLNLKVTKTEKRCRNGCMTAMELTVANIEQLAYGYGVYQKIKINNIAWELGVVRDGGEHVGIELIADKATNVRIMIQIRSQKANVNSIRKVIFRDIQAKSKLHIQEIISWQRLLNRENCFLNNKAVKIEIEITNGKYLKDSIEVNEVEADVHPDFSFPKCGFCSKDFVNQALSYVPCGHVFCKDCIVSAVKAFKMCPTCKQSADLDRLRFTTLPS